MSVVFKRGDRVVCVDDSYSYHTVKGQVYTISKSKEGFVELVDFNGLVFRAERFELKKPSSEEAVSEKIPSNGQGLFEVLDKLTKIAKDSITPVSPPKYTVEYGDATIVVEHDENFYLDHGHIRWTATAYRTGGGYTDYDSQGIVLF